MNRHLKLPIGAALALVATACNSPQGSSPTQGKTRVLVEYSLKPLLEAEIDVFQKIYKQAEIEAVYLYDAQLMAQFVADSADLAITSHPLPAKDLEAIQNEKIWPEQLDIAKDGLALVASAAFPFDALTTGQLKSILLAKADALPFHVVFDHEGSATVRYLEENLLGSQAVSESCFAAESDSALLSHIKTHVSAIGIIGVNSIVEKSDTTEVNFISGIKILGLLGTDGQSHQPHQSALYTGQYPLTRTITLYNREARSGLATGFAAFLASERGQRIVLRQGLVPATMPVRLVEITKRPLN